MAFDIVFGRLLGFVEAKDRVAADALTRDLLAGFVSCLVTIAFGLSFAAMIFNGELAASLSQGISMVLTCAGITIIVVSLMSPFILQLPVRIPVRPQCRARSPRR